MAGLGGIQERRAALMNLISIIEMGKLKPSIDRSYPFEDIVAAHRYVEQGHKKGNVVINVE